MQTEMNSKKEADIWKGPTIEQPRYQEEFCYEYWWTE